jgi:competence protein ComEC
LVRQVWNAVAATLAAQILTLPFVLYHFHQFPLMFLLANLVAVPLSVVILYGLLLLVCIGWWQAAAAMLGTLITWLIQFMNFCIGTIDAWWFAKIGNIHYLVAQAVALALVISFGAGWLYKRGSGQLVAASLSLLALLGMRVAQKSDTMQQHKLIVYNVPKHLAVDYVSGKSCLFLGDTALAEPGFARNFHLQPSRLVHQVQPPVYRSFNNDSLQMLQAGGQTILFLHKSVDVRQSSPLSPDVLVVSHYVKTRPSEVLGLLRPRQIVLSANMWPAQVSRWKNAADSLHLRLHSVAEEGAFVLPL